MLSNKTTDKIKDMRKDMRKDFDSFYRKTDRDDIYHCFNVLFTALDAYKRNDTRLNHENEKLKKHIESTNRYLSRLGLTGNISGRE